MIKSGAAVSCAQEPSTASGAGIGRWLGSSWLTCLTGAPVLLATTALCPRGCRQPNGGKPHNNMLFASVKPSVIAATGATKQMEMREREELTEEDIIKKFAGK